MSVQVTPEASTIMFVSLGVYFAIVLSIEMFLEKLVKSAADYFLGSRRLGSYVIAFSERAVLVLSPFHSISIAYSIFARENRC
ncbi:MAG: hypothetical protein ABWW65_05195 [Thermoprotei archaeon]